MGLSDFFGQLFDIAARQFRIDACLAGIFQLGLDSLKVDHTVPPSEGPEPVRTKNKLTRIVLFCNCSCCSPIAPLGTVAHVNVSRRLREVSEYPQKEGNEAHFVDLSIYWRTTSSPTSPPFGPRIKYHTHEDGAGQIASFPGLRKEDLPDGQRWAERISVRRTTSIRR